MPKAKPKKKSKPAAAAPSLDHLYVATGNFEAAWKFWTGVVGLPVRHQWGDGDHQAGALGLGDATVVLAQEPPSVRTEFGYSTDHGRPQIFVRGLETGETVKGIGEPPVPPAAPALASAIFALTGTRLREMPFARSVRFA